MLRRSRSYSDVHMHARLTRPRARARDRRGRTSHGGRILRALAALQVEVARMLGLARRAANRKPGWLAGAGPHTGKFGRRECSVTR